MNFLISPFRISTRLIIQLVLLLAVGLSSNVYAADSFVVKDIRVEGLQRVEPGTVFSYLSVQVGDTFTEEKGAEAIKSLYSTGFFRDVQIQAQGNVLIVIVEERPTISRIEFTGMKEFDVEVVKKSLKTVGVAEARFYDKALIDKAEQELKRQYINRSMYATEVVSTVTPIERNRVNLNFSVVEGDTAKIASIQIVGNKAFSESTLRSQFDSDTAGWLTWYTKANRYSSLYTNGSKGYLYFCLGCRST